MRRTAWLALLLGAIQLPSTACGDSTAEERCSAACDSLEQCGYSCLELLGCEEDFDSSDHDVSDWDQITSCITSKECALVYRVCLACRTDDDCLEGERCVGSGPDASCEKG